MGAGPWLAGPRGSRSAAGRSRRRTSVSRRRRPAAPERAPRGGTPRVQPDRAPSLEKRVRRAEGGGVGSEGWGRGGGGEHPRAADVAVGGAVLDAVVVGPRGGVDAAVIAPLGGRGLPGPEHSRFRLLNAPRAYTKAPRIPDLLWRALRALKRPGWARTEMKTERIAVRSVFQRREMFRLPLGCRRGARVTAPTGTGTTGIAAALLAICTAAAICAAEACAPPASAARAGRART
jgi:hypothetical protein